MISLADKGRKGGKKVEAADANAGKAAQKETVKNAAIDGAASPEEANAQENAIEIDLDALKTEVEGIFKERDQYLSMLQRVTADFDNYKKRNAQLRMDVEQNTKCDVIGAMLPVLDNLERALQAAQSSEGEGLAKGVDMVARQFVKVMEDLGVQEIASQPGDAFDPELHNAVVIVPSDDEHADNTVFDTLQKGYRCGDKVLRYAMVRVAQDA